MVLLLSLLSGERLLRKDSAVRSVTAHRLGVPLLFVHAAPFTHLIVLQ